MHKAALERLECLPSEYPASDSPKGRKARIFLSGPNAMDTNRVSGFIRDAVDAMGKGTVHPSLQVVKIMVDGGAVWVLPGSSSTIPTSGHFLSQAPNPEQPPKFYFALNPGRK